jgi:multicomponent Na+:H+ antiporter subunit E
MSVRGGVDVARRVLSPRVDIDPGVIRYTFTDLPPGGGRLVFVAVVGLCPGTLCFDLEDEAVSVHVLDRHGPVQDELGRIEAAIVALFGIDREAH